MTGKKCGPVRTFAGTAPPDERERLSDPRNGEVFQSIQRALGERWVLCGMAWNPQSGARPGYYWARWADSVRARRPPGRRRSRMTCPGNVVRRIKDAVERHGNVFRGARSGFIQAGSEHAAITVEYRLGEDPQK